MGDFEVNFLEVLSSTSPVRSILHILASVLQALQVLLLKQCITLLTDSVCLAPFLYTALFCFCFSSPFFLHNVAELYDLF